MRISTTQANFNNQRWWLHSLQRNKKDRLWILWQITLRYLLLQLPSHASLLRDLEWTLAPKEFLCPLIGRIQWVQSIFSIKRKRGVSLKRVLKIQILRAKIEDMLFSNLAQKTEVLRVPKRKRLFKTMSPRNWVSRTCFLFPSSKFRCPNYSEPMLLPILRSLSVRVSAQMEEALKEFLKMRESIALQEVSVCVRAKHRSSPWPLLMEVTPTKKPVLIPFLGSNRGFSRNRTARKEINKNMVIKENFSLKWGKIWP